MCDVMKGRSADQISCCSCNLGYTINRRYFRTWASRDSDAEVLQASSLHAVGIDVHAGSTPKWVTCGSMDMERRNRTVSRARTESQPNDWHLMFWKSGRSGMGVDSSQEFGAMFVFRHCWLRLSEFGSHFNGCYHANQKLRQQNCHCFYKKKRSTIVWEKKFIHRENVQLDVAVNIGTFPSRFRLQNGRFIKELNIWLQGRSRTWIIQPSEERVSFASCKDPETMDIILINSITM